MYLLPSCSGGQSACVFTLYRQQQPDSKKKMNDLTSVVWKNFLLIIWTHFKPHDKLSYAAIFRSTLGWNTSHPLARLMIIRSIPPANQWHSSKLICVPFAPYFTALADNLIMITMPSVNVCVHRILRLYLCKCTHAFRTQLTLHAGVMMQLTLAWSHFRLLCWYIYVVFTSSEGLYKPELLCSVVEPYSTYAVYLGWRLQIRAHIQYISNILQWPI